MSAEQSVHRAVLSSHTPCPQEAGDGHLSALTSQKGSPGDLVPSGPQCHHQGNKVIMMTPASLGYWQDRIDDKDCTAGLDALGAGAGTDSPNLDLAPGQMRQILELGGMGLSRWARGFVRTGSALCRKPCSRGF